MKRTLLALMALPLLALAQGPPNCSQSLTFTTSTAGAAVPASAASTACAGWRLTWKVHGFTAVTIQLEGSQDNSTWAAFGAALVQEGANPTAWTSATTSNTIVVRASLPYVRVNITHVTGSGTVSTVLLGYVGTSAQQDTGGGSGGTATNLAGGVLGSVPYQTAPGTTGMAAPNTTTNTLCFLETGTGSAGGAPQFGICPTSSAELFYFSDTASSIATYLQMTAQPYSPKTTLTYTGQIGTVTNTLQNWATNAGVPGLTYIPAGQYLFHIHAARTNAFSGSIQLQCEFVEVDASGADIHVIGTSEPSVVLTTLEVEYTLAFADGDVYNLASSSSRIVARVQAVNTSILLSSNVLLYVGGTADSHIQLPVNGGSGGSPTGPAGGVLSGNYPDPGFASTQGNGPKTQLSTGSTVPGDCTEYDSSGNTVDAGFPCRAAVGTAEALTVYSRELVALPAGTLYFPAGGGALPDATEANVATLAPVNLIVSNFSAVLSAAPGVGNSVAFTWRKNGVSQPLTCTISGGAATSCTDSTHSFTVVAADVLDVQAVVTGTIAGTPNIVLTVAAGSGAGLPTSAVTYYVASTGSNSNDCLTVPTACLTLAHVVGLVSSVVPVNYTIHVADGTYAEAVSIQGFAPAQQISVIGNTTTPANVVFSGSVACVVSDGSYTAEVCNSGGWLNLQGVTLTGAATRGIFTSRGRTVLANVVQSGVTTYAIETAQGTVEMNADVTASNWTGYGVYNTQKSMFQLYTGTLTLTGPGSSSTGVGIVQKEQSLFSIHGNATASTATFSISEVNYCVYQTEQSEFVNTNGNFGAMTCSNASAGTATAGIYSGTLSNWFANPSGGITVNNFNTCWYADGNSFVAQKSATNNNCTATQAFQQAQIILF